MDFANYESSLISPHNPLPHDFAKASGESSSLSDPVDTAEPPGRASAPDLARHGSAPHLEGARDGVEPSQRSAQHSPGPRVAIIMGSKSDWPTLEHAAKTLAAFEVPFEAKVVSAHRTPDLLFEYVAGAEARGLKVIIAGAGGAAHLPGMAASKTTLPVLGVPIRSQALLGVDSLLSIVQMPKGIPVGTLAIGEAGAANAALLAVAMLATTDEPLNQRLKLFRRQQTDAVLEATL